MKLRKLIACCWSVAGTVILPSDQALNGCSLTKFEEFYQSTLIFKIFAQILAEAISGGEVLVSQLLNKLKLPSGTPKRCNKNNSILEREKIPWTEFRSAYASIFGHDAKIDAEDFECLKVLLDVKVDGEDGDGGDVSTSNILNFTLWWKPRKAGLFR